MEVKFLVPFFEKKVPFVAPNIKHLPKFLEYALPWNFHMLSFACLMLDFYLE